MNRAPIDARHKKKQREANKLYVRSLRETGHCVDCGDTERLEFDHLPEFKKHMDISTLVSKHSSRLAIDTELNKCVLRCHDCHRRVTKERLENTI